MKTILKKHNVEPVKKVLDAFNAGEQRVALAHATGTGKSYATCAIIEQGNFKNVLYLSPSNHINKYFERVVIKNLGNRQAINILATYSFLLHRDLKSLAGKYDLIVLDEYHRLGAREWGKAAKVLLELNPQAKILGLTATEVRYLDNWRNMSKELNFKVISTITLVDAIERRILPAPEYIIGFSDFDIIIKELEDLAIKCKDDKEYLEKIKKMKVDWVNSNGLAGIVKYHLPITTSKIVVFSEAIERYDKIVEKMTEILTAAGFKNLKFLRADSDTKDSISNIEYFSTNNDKNEVKVIISVNMLNEGIHADGAEACFMFRKTHSATIFLQQLGRVESSLDPKKKPIVFDLVNNISNDWELFTKIGLKQRGEAVTVNRHCVKRVFGEAGIRVTSYVDEAEHLLMKLKSLFRSSHDTDDLENFIKTKGNYPSRKSEDEYEKKLAVWEYKQRKNNNEKVISLYNQYGSIRYCLDDLINHLKQYNEWPKQKDNRGLYNWASTEIKRGNKDVIDLWEQFKYVFCCLQDLIEYLEVFGKWPEHGSSLYNWAHRRMKKGDKKVIELYKQYHTPAYTEEDFLQLLNTLGRWPYSCGEEKSAYIWAKSQMKKGNKRIIKLFHDYGPGYLLSIMKLKIYLEKYNEWPKCTKNKGLYSWARKEMLRGNQEVIDLYNQYHPDKPWRG